MKNTVEIFLSLVRAGLWEQDVRLAAYGQPDFAGIFKLAKEQSVYGLVAAGLEHVTDMKIQKADAVPFLKLLFKTEQRNEAMNTFISELFPDMEKDGIKCVLIKGQGVAQCYERPLWRACGDVDLLVDKDNYKKTKELLGAKASAMVVEVEAKRHLAMQFGRITVELHGVVHTDISPRIDSVVDQIQEGIFKEGRTRLWDNGGTMVRLPVPDDDIIIVFTHFIGHFYVGGVGLRQIADWCRQLWIFRDKIDFNLLRKRLEMMDLVQEWQAFATFAAEYLGMPREAMPFFEESRQNRRRARRILSLVIHAGNFGHNKDESYRRKHSKRVSDVITFFRRIGEFVRLATIFPSKAPEYFLTYVRRRDERAAEYFDRDDRGNPIS